MLGKGEAGIQSPTITPRGDMAVGWVGGLTRWEATAKEHVEEVFRGDVSLKATVEVAMPMAVPGCLALVITELVVLLPFLWVAKYCVCCANGWKGGRQVRPGECWRYVWRLPWQPRAHFLQVLNWCFRKQESLGLVGKLGCWASVRRGTCRNTSKRIWAGERINTQASCSLPHDKSSTFSIIGPFVGIILFTPTVFPRK